MSGIIYGAYMIHSIRRSEEREPSSLSTGKCTRPDHYPQEGNIHTLYCFNDIYQTSDW